MKGIAITHQGAEEICAAEVKELIGAKAEKRDGAVVFPVKKAEDLCKLSYMGQSIKRVLLLLKESKVSKKLPDAEKALEGQKLKEYFGKATTFRVDCIRKGEHDFQSTDIGEEFGAAIVEMTKAKVNLENPDLIFLVYIQDSSFYFGIDFCGFDLSKREYKIFNSPFSLKGTVAYSLLRMSGYKKTDVLLDPFCDTGAIVIEAAFFASGFSVNNYAKGKYAFQKLKMFEKTDFNKFFEKLDKKVKISGDKFEIYAYDAQLRKMKQAQKNAKIAGINKMVQFSRVDVSWLDIKFKKEQADLIVTALPVYSPRQDISQLEKEYKEFFYQAEYILTKVGKICLICNKPDIVEKHSQAYKFRLDKKQEIMQGGLKLFVLTFSK